MTIDRKALEQLGQLPRTAAEFEARLRAARARAVAADRVLEALERSQLGGVRVEQLLLPSQRQPLEQLEDAEQQDRNP